MTYGGSDVRRHDEVGGGAPRGVASALEREEKVCFTTGGEVERQRRECESAYLKFRVTIRQHFKENASKRGFVFRFLRVLLRKCC